MNRKRHPWTEGELDTLSAMRRRGATFDKRKHEDYTAPRAEAKSRARPRPCLNCRRMFQSEGPHHRLCAICRGQSLSSFDTPARIGR